MAINGANNGMTVRLSDFINISGNRKGRDGMQQSRVRIAEREDGKRAVISIGKDTYKTLVNLFQGQYVNVYVGGESCDLILTSGTQRKMTRPSASGTLATISCTDLVPVLEKYLGKHTYYWYDRGSFLKDEESGRLVFIMKFTGYEPSEV